MLGDFGATFAFYRRGKMFICIKVIRMIKIYSINNKKSNQWSSIDCRTGIISIIVRIVISNM